MDQNLVQQEADEFRSLYEHCGLIEVENTMALREGLPFKTDLWLQEKKSLRPWSALDFPKDNLLKSFLD